MELEAEMGEYERTMFGLSSDNNEVLISEIHDAAARGDIAAVMELTEKGWDINLTDKANNTPLHYASGAGHTGVIDYLVSQGANLEATNILGDTPLHRAVWRLQKPSVEFLLKSGAKVDALNKDRKKPIDLCRGDVPIGALLQRSSGYTPVDAGWYTGEGDDDSPTGGPACDHAKGSGGASGGGGREENEGNHDDNDSEGEVDDDNDEEELSGCDTD